jgi:hypothetical protein
MKKAFLTILTLILINGICFSQTQPNNNNIRINRRYGISIKAGGIFGSSIAFDAFITPTINTEINFNYLIIIYGGGVGVYYHPWGRDENKNWSPYVGIHCDYYIIDPLDHADILSFYFPIGMHYTGKKGFNFAFDLGYYYRIDLQVEKHHLPMGSIKFGYRF